jgi:hypothetical protein
MDYGRGVGSKVEDEAKSDSLHPKEKQGRSTCIYRLRKHTEKLIYLLCRSFRSLFHGSSSKYPPGQEAVEEIEVHSSNVTPQVSGIKERQ